MCRKMFWGATLPGCFVLALVWGMLALPGSSLADPPDGNGNHNHNHGGGGGGGGGKIPVTVTFRDFKGDDLDPVPDRLMSDCHDCPTTCDCLSPYSHQVDNVNAFIAKNLVFGPNKRNQPAIRTLFFDFSDCIEGPCEPPFPSPSFSTGQTGMFTRGVKLREMFVGEVREDLGLTMAFDLTNVGGGVWDLFFDLRPTRSRT